MLTLPPSWAVVTKYGSLNFLEPSGPVQACNGTDLLLISFTVIKTFYSLDGLRVPCKVRLENVERAEHAGQVK